MPFSLKSEGEEETKVGVGIGEEHGTGAPMYVLWHQHLMSSFSRPQINTCIFKKSCVD